MKFGTIWLKNKEFQSHTLKITLFKEKYFVYDIYLWHPLYLCHHISPYKLDILFYTFGHLSFMYDIHGSFNISQVSSSKVHEAIWTYTI